MTPREELAVMEADAERLERQYDNSPLPAWSSYQQSRQHELGAVRQRIRELRKWVDAQEADGA